MESNFDLIVYFSGVLFYFCIWFYFWKRARDLKHQKQLWYSSIEFMALSHIEYLYKDHWYPDPGGYAYETMETILKSIRAGESLPVYMQEKYK